MPNTSEQYRFFLEDDYETLLIEEPKGIQDITSVLERDLDAHGVFFEFTESDIKLEFCGDARDFLEERYLSKGTNKQVDFIIEKKKNITDTWNEIFRSQVNYTTREINETYFKCAIEKISQFEDLKNRFDTKVSLDETESLEGVLLSDISAKKVGMHSKLIKKIIDVSGDSSQSANIQYATNDSHTVFIFFGFPDTVQLDIIDYFTYPLQFDKQDSSGANVNDTQKFVIQAKESGLITINSILDFTALFQNFIGTFDYTLRLYYQINTNTPVALGSLYSDTNVSSDFVSFAETISDLEIDLEVNDKFYFFVRIEISSIGPLGGFKHAISYDTTNTLNIVQNSTRPFSISNLYQVHDAVNKIAEAVTNRTGILRSTILGNYSQGYSEDGCLSRLHLGSGWALRNFASSEKATITEFKDFIESFNALFALGWGFEITPDFTNLRIEHFTHFYGDKELIDLQEVDDYEEETEEDLIFSQVKLKFNKYANDEDEKNTTDDFHTEVEYQTPIRKNKKTFEKKSSYIMSPYLIENTREKQFDENPTESFKYDDDIFLIQTVDIGQTQITGVFDVYDNTLTVPLWYYNQVLKYAETFDVTGSTFNDGTWTYSRLNVIETSTEAIITINETFVNDETTNCTIIFPGLELRAETNEAFDYDGSVSGLISPETSYNLRWTLARALRYWELWINSGLHYEESTQRLKNTFFKNNGSLVTQLDSDECTIVDDDLTEITENYSPRISELANGARLWSPDIIKFQKKLEADKINLIIEAHKNNVTNVSFTEDSLLEVEEGVLLEVDVNTNLLLDQETVVQESKNYGYISCRNYNNEKVSGWILTMRYNIINEICEFELLKKANFTDTSTYIKLLESGFSKLLENGDFKLLEDG